MKKLCLVVLIFLFVITSGAQSVSEKLNQFFEAAQKAGVFTGSVLVVRKGDILINKGYGYKDAEAKTLNDSNTLYQIGSVTKQFTSTIILKLAEQGRLSLKDKLSKYFPEFSYANKITLEHLLTHTSGIFNYTDDTTFITKGWYGVTKREEIFAVFRNKPLSFEPGSKYSYSNSGYFLLGCIIEKVTGKKYETVVRDIIFKPLKMSQSGFDFIHLKSPNKATGYYTLSDDLSSKAKVVDSTVSFSAGAIYSTTGDLYKWDQSLSSHKILTQKSLENAFTPRLSKYGFGYIIDSIFGHKIISHNGGIDGFLSHNTIIPADDIQIIILTNTMSTKITPVTAGVFSILYNQPYQLPQAKQIISIDTSVLKQYVGEYELAPTFKIAITLVNGSLKAQATGQPAFEIYASKANVFFYKVVDAQIEFIKNEKGEVDKLILHQSGQHLAGMKVK